MLNYLYFLIKKMPETLPYYTVSRQSYQILAKNHCSVDWERSDKNTSNSHSPLLRGNLTPNKYITNINYCAINYWILLIVQHDLCTSK